MWLKYSLEELAALRSALLWTLMNGPSRDYVGVCYNLQRIVEMGECPSVDVYGFVDSEAMGWPHTETTLMDGVLVPQAYFVPHTHGFGLWEGPNRARRRCLIRYLLGRVAHYESLHRGGVALAV